MPKIPENTLTFRSRARIVRTVGDELVKGPEAALIELIKNAHDADATNVRVVFTPGALAAEDSGFRAAQAQGVLVGIPPEANNERLTGACWKMGSIDVCDDGHGMDETAVTERWMEPATSNKRERKTSPGGRRMLGAKGIGRFASNILGSKLGMITCARITSDQAVERDATEKRFETVGIPEIDWDEFTDERYLDSISFPYEKFQTVDGTTGTVLKISQLRHHWNRTRLENLLEELRRLTTPLNDSGATLRGGEPTGFRIYLDLSALTLDTVGFSGLDVLGQDEGTEDPWLVEPFPLLNACDYEVDGIFDESGAFSGTLQVHRGGLEPLPIAFESPLNAGEESPCGIVIVRLFIFDRDADSVKKSAARAGLASVSAAEARRLLDAVSGIGIYRESFRIRPYGRSDYDWLTLDKKRVQDPSRRIGHNQVSGYVLVENEEESSLIEQSSREGLRENGAYVRLKRLVSELLATHVEPQRKMFREKAGLDRRNDLSFEKVYKSVKLGWARMLVSKVPQTEQAEIEALIRTESDRLEGYVRELEKRQAKLESRVTLGLLLGEVMHEMNTPLAFIEEEIDRLGRWWPAIVDPTVDSVRKESRMPDILGGMDSSAGRIRRLVKTLRPLAGRRRGPRSSFGILDEVSSVSGLFATRFADGSIVVLAEADAENVKGFGWSDDLAVAITNLLDNAIYWLEHHQVSEPKIEVGVSRHEQYAQVVVRDNGPGVLSEYVDRLFDVGFSLKPNGTGLGLNIASESLARSGATLELMDTALGACFQIRFPMPEVVE